MRTFLKRIFIENWPRKVVALILASIIWMFVTHSMTTTKTFHKVPIKIINIPPGKIIEGLQDNGFYNQTINITLTGNKNILEDLTGSDLEIILNAEGKENDWIVYITPKNLVCLNPDIDIQKNVTKLIHHSFILKVSQTTTQRIPVHITPPIGEAPKGYFFVDIKPYQLYVTVNGPIEAVKYLKTTGLKLTFNLNDITQQDLEQIASSHKEENEISFFVPDSWKKIVAPFISNIPIQIDDPQTKNLRINFTKTELLPIETSIPVSLYFSLKTSNALNPNTHILATNDFIQDKNGIKIIHQPLYVKGVSQTFLNVVKDMTQIVITVTNNSSFWNIQFVYPHELEDHYVNKIMAEAFISDQDSIQPHLREDYLRNRFRNYMNRFRLYTSDNKKLSLDIKIDTDTINVIPKK